MEIALVVVGVFIGVILDIALFDGLKRSDWHDARDWEDRLAEPQGRQSWN